MYKLLSSYEKLYIDMKSVSMTGMRNKQVAALQSDHYAEVPVLLDYSWTCRKRMSLSENRTPPMINIGHILSMVPTR